MQLKWPMLWDLFSLFPAYAGVILYEYGNNTAELAFPRIRGGDPSGSRPCIQYFAFSPHTRG